MSGKNDINEMSLLELFLLETGHQAIKLKHDFSIMADANMSVDYDALLRAIHSIKGAARIVDLQSVIALTKCMENLLRDSKSRLQSDQNLQLTFESCIDILTEIGKAKPSQLLGTLKDKKNVINNLIGLLSFSGQKPAAPPMADRADETANYQTPPEFINLGLFSIFKEDADTNLATLSNNLIKLENNPRSVELLESSMRSVHSLKGAARIIELHKIVQLTHTMEDIFVAAQEGHVVLGTVYIDSLLRALDLLKELTEIEEKFLSGWFAANDPEIEARIAELSELHVIAVNSDDHSLTAGFSEPVDGEFNLNPPLAESLARERESAAPPHDDTSIRVASQAMTRMMGLAGEVMIESRWLPVVAKRSLRLRRSQNHLWYSLSKLRRQLLESGTSPLLDHIYEKVSTELKLCQNLLNEHISEIDEHAHKAAEISHRLHSEIISIRMQPFSEGIKGLPRLIRDLSKKQHKEVLFKVVGADTLVDRDILAKLESPLTHLVTNALDHGIEAPEIRRTLKKKEQATLLIEAKHVAGMLYITVADDGAGLDIQSIREKIVAKKLVSEKISRELTDSELKEFLFLPNFSTKKEVSKTSGRGVGLDLVHSTIKEIRGSIQVQSVRLQGTTFELRLPLTLSIIRGLIVMINQEPYAIPLVNIDHVIRLARSEIKELEGRQYFTSKNKQIGIIAAQQVLDLNDSEPDDDILSVIVLQGEFNSYGLIVDTFHGIRDLVIQPLNQRLGKLRSISAASIAEDGTPILILDIQDLVQTMDHLISGNRLKPIKPLTKLSKRRQTKRILVVDDSITVREVERKILTDYGYETEVAVDGVDAWNHLRVNDFDLVITDIDMPHMDGIELVVHIKESDDYHNMPVIIVSYKDREEDKTRGLDAGADYYLTKGSFHTQTLIDAVEDLIGGPTENDS